MQFFSGESKKLRLIGLILIISLAIFWSVLSYTSLPKNSSDNKLIIFDPNAFRLGSSSSGGLPQPNPSISPQISRNFGSLWGIDDRAVFEMLSALDEIFIRLNVSYFIVGTTLLGSLRYGAPLPWDSNLYLGVPFKQFEENKEGILSALGSFKLGLDALDQEGKEYALFFERKGNMWKYRMIIMTMEILGDIKLGDDIYPFETFFGPKATKGVLPHAGDCLRRNVAGFMVCAPANPELVLSQRFGPYWRDLCSARDVGVLCDDLTYPVIRNVSKIPKIIHQLWIGNRAPAPKRIMRTCESLHPDWEYKFWTDSNIPINIEVQEAFKLEKTLNGKADILRWQLLKMYGGIWIDADTFVFDLSMNFLKLELKCLLDIIISEIPRTQKASMIH